jgi:phosphohistidine phosphatase SixA
VLAWLALAIVLFLAGCGEDEGDAAPAASATPPPAAQVRLARTLTAGGQVLVFRHAKTGTEIAGREVLGDCSTQRNLSVQGQAQARQLGRDMRALGVPVGTVLASPLCRTAETAQLAFGRARETRDLVSPGVVGTEADDRRRVRRLVALANTPPAAGTTTVLVTHTGNIGGAFGEETVQEGEALVLAPVAGAARPRLVGRVGVEDWVPLRTALG